MRTGQRRRPAGRATGLPAGPLAARLAWRAAALAAGAAVAVAAAPVSLVAAVAVAAAWLNGWPPRRLGIAAAWCGPMVAVWLGWAGMGRGGVASAWLVPYHAWLAFWRLGRAGAYARAAAGVAPASIPLGLGVAAVAWSYRVRSLASGAGGVSPASGVSFDRRQWRHQVRWARARIAAPGSVPLTLRGDRVGVGAVIRAVGHRTGPVADVGYGDLRSHQVVVGTTGTGKTTLLLRLWTGFMATGLRRQAAGLGDAPLLVVLDCKGGSDARRVADRFRRVLRDAGARSTAIWPDEASLSLWSLPPRELTTTLVDLIEHGTGSAAYYTDVMEALVALAVEAPCGPPAGAHDLLERLEPGWLSAAYAATGTAADHAMIRSAARHLADVALRYRTLFRRLGGGLDGPGGFGDADAWYCILEGTDQVAVAESQARALVELLASYAVRGPRRREILLAVDEFSAVSRRLPIWQLYERARSLGLAVQVSAQSWEGLGGNEDERRRIAATADGGLWLLRTPRPEPITDLAGTRAVVRTARHLARLGWSHQGTSELHDGPTADPELIRALDTGQVARIYRGGVTYIQVKRLVAAPPAVGASAGAAARGATEAPAAHAGAGRVAPVSAPSDPARPREAALPDVSPVLDAAFGPAAPP